MIAAIILPCATITFNKVVSMDFSSASAGTLPMPFWFVICDIITEVYGYKISRQIIWSALICNLVFAICTTVLIDLPSPKSWLGEASYIFVFRNMLLLSLSGLFALIIGGFINSYLISKWKILTGGRYFWLRSIGSSTIGEAFYTMLAFLFIFAGSSINLKIILTFMMWSYIFKILGATILSGPANLIVNYLKAEEKIDVYDKNVDFNPFKIST